MRAEIPPAGLDPDRLASQVQDQLGEEIDLHLRADGLEPVGRLGASGIRLRGPAPLPGPDSTTSTSARRPSPS